MMQRWLAVDDADDCRTVMQGIREKKKTFRKIKKNGRWKCLKHFRTLSFNYHPNPDKCIYFEVYDIQ